MSLYTPNLKVLKDWRGSLNVAFSILRRVAFVIEDTFSFGDFNPQTNWQGMTVTNYQVYRARYLKIFKMMWVSLDIRGTVAAPLTTNVSVILPATGGGGEDSSQQSSANRLVDNSVNEVGFSALAKGSNEMYFYRAPIANFTAGPAIITFNGFLETL